MEGYIGQVILFAGNFAPRTWAFCDGQLLAINQNQALFSIIGTIYGGDGRTTFALPDLRGRVAIGPRNGPGLSDYRQGARGGLETVTLNQTQIPSHTHPAALATASGPADDPQAAGRYLASGRVDVYSQTPGGPSLAGLTVGNTGGNQSHENRMPYLALNYVICLQGIFPSRA